jgi:hypothetical protein
MAQPSADGPPPAPTDLAVTGGGESATLSWRQPPGPRARSFRVYEGGAVVARNTTTAVWLTNLGFARTHTYAVTAVDAAGRESARSTPITRTLGISGVPPFCLPAGLTGLTASRIGPTAATLSWVNVGDQGTAVITGGPAGPVTTTQSGARIGGLTPGTAYTFTVTRWAFCSGTAYPPATVTLVTPPGAAGSPGAPLSPTVAQRTDTTLTLAWQPPAAGPPPVRYVVYDAGRPVAATGGTSATVRDLYHAASYAFQVAAVDARGNESPGAPVSGSTATCQTTPPRPFAVTATALSASSARLEWTYEAAATAYTVYDGPTVVGASAGSAVVVGGLASAATHRLRVAATLAHQCGQSPTSAAVTVTTPAGPTGRPAQPVDLRMVSGDPMTGTVTLQWTQPATGDPAVSYRVYRDTDVLATTDTPGVALALPMATTQVLSVAAVNSSGLESAHSVPLTVRVPYLPPP